MISVLDPEDIKATRKNSNKTFRTRENDTRVKDMQTKPDGHEEDLNLGSATSHTILLVCDWLILEFKEAL